jgi:dTDP-4-dehydrorhamnose 3,5-epimerase
MVVVRTLRISDVLEITPARHGDHRGFFSEVWSRSALAQQGIEIDFVQDNHSYSAAAGVLRGLHYQEPPFAQAKLVRVIRGSVFDVAVDIRHGSPSFGQWVGLTLSTEAWNQLLVPVGFAHGFVTLGPDCEVLYKTSAPYSPGHDRAIRFDDPQIGVEWPIPAGQVILSNKDRAAPLLREAEPAFFFEQSE